MNRMRVAGAIAGAAALLLVATSTLPAETEAAWTTQTAAQGQFTAGVTPPPGTLACSGGGTFILGNTPPTVTFTWAAAANPAGALPVSGYAWTLSQGATVISSGTTTTTARTASIPGTLTTAGNFAFTVTATGPGGWISQPGPAGTYTKTDAILFILLGTSGCSV